MIAYSVYMILSVLISLTVASVPALLIIFWCYETIDSVIVGWGFPFSLFPNFIQGTFGDILPSFMYEKFWFIMLIVPEAFIAYGIFLGFLIGMFKLSRRGIPFLEDGYYPMETEEWLLYEYFEIYYVLFPYFAWFFSVFLDTKPRHTLFGAKIGENTVVGNGRLFNPERTIIGDNCFFGYDAIVSGHVYEGDRLYLKTVKLGNGVTIGANAVVLAGADIGDNVIIGANTVVPKDKVIPPNTIWIRGKAIPRKKDAEEKVETGMIGYPHEPSDEEDTDEECEEN